VRDELLRFGNSYDQARSERFSAHPLAQFIRGELAVSVGSALGQSSAGLVITGSCGAGNWATVPWVGLFIPHVTETATRGYYVVYLLASARRQLVLSLNQGATAVMAEFGTRAREVLRDRAALMRARLADFSNNFDPAPITLGSDQRLPLAYEAGHAFGRVYDMDQLPEEGHLHSDLLSMVEAYRTLDFRGGLDPTPDAVSAEDGEGAQGKGDERLLEVRRYRMHQRIERNRKAAEQAKKYHGYACQGCGFSFTKRYGALGANYIEAHHLTPLASLNPGIPVVYEIAKDFAVLCSNCHSMIHKTNDPSDMDGFRALIDSNGT